MSDISTKQVHSVRTRKQMELLASPVRQEIVDQLAAMGPSTIRQLAVALGLPADALYHHVRKLVGGGLLVEDGNRPTRRRSATVYRLPAEELRLAYDVSPAGRAVLQRVIGAALRSAGRDFGNGLASKEAITEGSGRNLWAGRTKGWLSPEDLAEVNDLLERILTRFQAVGPGENRRLCSFSWVIAPVEAAPPRRDAGPA